MDFNILHHATSSMVVATITSFGALIPTQPLSTPTPAPLIKTVIQQEVKIQPQVTVEKFIGPTLPITEPEIKASESETKKEIINNEATAEAKPTLVETKSPEPSPTTLPVTTKPASQNFDLIWQMVNDHRNKIGLPAFEKDERLCKIAENRGPQLQNEIFGSGTMHQGMYDLNLPYWNTENIVAYESEQRNFDWWMSDAIHRQAIESNNKYSCGTCFGNACVQEFSSFTPK